MRIKIARHVVGIKQTVVVTNPPEGKRVQLFVYSFRSRLWYSQPSDVVFLGDTQHCRGLYRVVAVALDGPAVWGRRKALPTGKRSNSVIVHRTTL